MPHYVWPGALCDLCRVWFLPHHIWPGELCDHSHICDLGHICDLVCCVTPATCVTSATSYMTRHIVWPLPHYVWPSHRRLQWCTVDTEIKVPSVENPDWHAHFQEFLPYPNFNHPGPFTIIFSKSSPCFLTLLVLAVTVYPGRPME